MKKKFLTIFLITSLAMQPITWNKVSADVKDSNFYNCFAGLGSQFLNVKDLVENGNLKDLVDSELDAEKVIEVIDDLPEVNELTLEDTKSVVKARALVTAFNDDSAITNLDKLVAAENKINELKEEKAKEVQEAKELAAVTAIDKLPTIDELTLEDSKAVLYARKLVTRANNNPAITNLNKLVAAENKITELKEDSTKDEENKEQEAKELAAVSAIAALPSVDELTLEDSKAVLYARKLVNVANNNDAITNLDKLVAAEARIAELKENNEPIKDDKENCEDKVDNRNKSENNRRPSHSRDNNRGGNRDNAREGNRGGRNMGHSGNRGGGRR